ncbi:MAG: inositol monophosphatase family protein [Anaerolineae bacterium]
MLDLKPIRHAARLAAQLSRLVQAQHLGDAAQKDGREPVTLADYGAQAILGRALLRAYPEDGVSSEESASQFVELQAPERRAAIVALVASVLGEDVTESDMVRWLDQGRGRETWRMWTIDPIDGTKGFVAGRRYAIAVGTMEGGLPVAGLLACPGWPSRDGKGALFYGQRSAAYAESISGGKPVRVAVRPPAGLSGLKVVESVEAEHVDHEALGRVLAAAGLNRPVVQQIDSQDKYAMVAAGEAQVYLRLPKEADPRYRIWDHLAGTALVQAAGGSVTDLDGTLLDFSHGPILAANRGMVVTPGGPLHERLLEAVEKVFLSPPPAT